MRKVKRIIGITVLTIGIIALSFGLSGDTGEYSGLEPHQVGGEITEMMDELRERSDGSKFKREAQAE